MNKKIIIFLMFSIGLVFLFLVYNSITKEMSKQKLLESNKTLIVGRLDTLRLMQLAYCDAHSEYAPNFNALFEYMRHGKYLKIKQTQNPIDGQINADTVFLNPMIEVLGKPDLDLNHFKFIDAQASDVFLMEASKLNENGIELPVFEISTPIGAAIAKPLKVGDLNSANTNGNWK